jgi:GT2 family glycosyltransferase
MFAESVMARVSAVVVSHNGGDRVLRCLAALERQTRPLDEILLVDNASSDATLARVAAAHPAVRVVALPDNRGPGTARNVGLAAARGELVLWVDHDVLLEPDALERMLVARTLMPAEVVLPRIRLHPEREVVQCDGGAPHVVGTLVLRNGFRPLAELAPSGPTYVDAAPSGCMLVERRAIEAAGGFDESYFFYLEDLELSLRLRLFGLRLLCEPGAVAFHDRGSGTALAYRGRGVYPRERAHLLMRNRLRVVATHFAGRTILALAPTLLVYEAASLALALLHGWGGAWLGAWHWLFRHRREIALRRRWIQERRRLPDSAVLASGPLPIAPGLLRSALQRRLVELLGLLVAGNWRLARRLV